MRPRPPRPLRWGEPGPDSSPRVQAAPDSSSGLPPLNPSTERRGEPSASTRREGVVRGSWRKSLLVISAVALVTQLLLVAVPTTVRVPVEVHEAVSVFLVDYGRTPALVLPITNQRMVAYVYGDWNYYALRHQGLLDAIAAVFWPTQGTLGRKEITGPPTTEVIRSALGNDIQEIHTLRVERAAVERLHTRLDRVHHDRLGTAVSAYGMVFVHHTQLYTYWSNSNHMTAAWLEALGCDVRGPAFGSRWRVRPPPSG